MEVWKDIINYNGRYQISSFGNVKSIKNGLILNAGIGTSGYYHVNLYKDKIQKSVRIHKLVAIHFLSDYIVSKQVNHIDGNKLNNHYGNLEMLTNRENSNHYLNSIGKYDNGIIDKGGKWMVRVRIKNTRFSFGTYYDKSIALKVRNEVIEKYSMLEITIPQLKEKIIEYKLKLKQL
jgi:hypothetical protein